MKEEGDKITKLEKKLEVYFLQTNIPSFTGMISKKGNLIGYFGDLACIFYENSVLIIEEDNKEFLQLSKFEEFINRFLDYRKRGGKTELKKLIAKL